MHEAEKALCPRTKSQLSTNDIRKCIYVDSWKFSIVELVLRINGRQWRTENLLLTKKYLER